MRIIILLLITFSSLSAYSQSRICDSVNLKDGTRHFVMYLPASIKRNAPLLFVTHGYGSRPKWPKSLSKAADKYGFAICAPQGYKAPNGRAGWNVGYPVQKGWKQNDAKSLCKLAHIVQRRYHLSRKNTFFTGMSNGGDISYLLAYTNQKTFRAFFSVAGLTLSWIPDMLKMKRPVPFAEVHGTADHTSEWAGDPHNKGGWGAYLSVEDAINRIVKVNRCSSKDSIEMSSLLGGKGHKIIKYRYHGGRQGTEVWLYRVIGAPHCWHDKDLDIGEEEWKFFSKYLRK